MVRKHARGYHITRRKESRGDSGSDTCVHGHLLRKSKRARNSERERESTRKWETHTSTCSAVQHARHSRLRGQDLPAAPPPSPLVPQWLLLILPRAQHPTCVLTLLGT